MITDLTNKPDKCRQTQSHQFWRQNHQVFLVVNRFVLDDMERLGYHRNLVRHMVLSDTFHDISAIYHILNDAFLRKLKSGDRILTTPLPILRNSSRRSSITTGKVERIGEGLGSIPEAIHRVSSKPHIAERASGGLYSRRGSLPQHIRFFQPSTSSCDAEEILVEVDETGKPDSGKSSIYLQVPSNRKCIVPDYQR